MFVVLVSFIWTHFCSQWHKLSKVFVIEFIESSHVVTVADEPVNGREMLSLGQFLIQTPEHLYDTEGGCCDRIGEITTRGRHTVT